MAKRSAKDVDGSIYMFCKMRGVGARAEIKMTGAKSRDLAIADPSLSAQSFTSKELPPVASKFTPKAKMSQPATPEVTAPDQAPSNTGAAAHSYQHSLQQPQATTPTSAASPAADMAKDVTMSDRTPDRPVVSLCIAKLYHHSNL